LGRFVSTAQQHNARGSVPLEVDAIAGPMIDPHLADALSNRLHITRVSLSKPFDAPDDPCSCNHVAKSRKKRAKLFRTPDFYHRNKM
jgi:hypothetical protein